MCRDRSKNSSSPRRFVKRWCALFAVLAVFTDIAVAYNVESIQRRLTSLIEKKLDADDIPGLSIALIDDQRIVWAAGFGYADKAQDRLASADTIYPIGSLTMPLTAAAVMQLVDRGIVKLDEPIKQYLPQFAIRHRSDVAPAITVRQLLTHHAGLPAMHLEGMWSREPEPLSAVTRILRDDFATHAPGQVYALSHLGYAVLGQMIEATTAQPFERYLHEQLFSPLGMRDSSLRRSSSERHAAGYWRGRKEAPILETRDISANGVHSGVEDLARFVQMLFAGGKRGERVVLSPRAVEQLWQPHNLDVALDFDAQIGLGWERGESEAGRVGTLVWQHGASPFGRGYIVLTPEHKRGVVILTNASSGVVAIEEIGRAALDAMLVDLPLPVIADKGSVIPGTEAVSSNEALAGHYATVLGLVTVTVDGDRVRATILGKQFSLNARGDGTYDVDYRLFGMLPLSFDILKEIRIAAVRLGERQLATLQFRGRLFRFGQRFEAAPLSDTWRGRAGTYEVTNRDALLNLAEIKPARLLIESDVLMMRYALPGWFGLTVNVPLRAVSDTDAVIEGVGWLTGETLRVVRRGDEERLIYSGYELRRIGK